MDVGGAEPGGAPRRVRGGRASVWRTALKAGLGAAAAVGALLTIRALGSAGFYNLAYADSIVPALVEGARETVTFSAAVVPVGFAAGFLVGWGRTLRSWFPRAVGATYVEFFRSMPPLVLIAFAALFSFLMVRRFAPILNPFDVGLSAGVLALALHSSAYQAEIVRAGILSVPVGQSEAGESIGMRRWQIMFGVTLPQALRVSLPALGNEFASVIKDTSLLAAIAAMELSWRGDSLVSSAITTDFNLAFVVWAEIALIYFGITFLVTRTVRAIENRFKVPGLEAAGL